MDSAKQVDKDALLAAERSAREELASDYKRACEALGKSEGISRIQEIASEIKEQSQALDRKREEPSGRGLEGMAKRERAQGARESGAGAEPI